LPVEKRKKFLAAVERVARLVEDFAGGATVDVMEATAAARDADKFAQGIPANMSGVSQRAAWHAACFVWEAEEQGVSGHAIDDDRMLMHASLAIQCSIPAAKVAARSDYEKLLRLSPMRDPQLGPEIDPSESAELGALWSQGAPAWSMMGAQAKVW
jgi:hypothetical protein